MVDVELSGGLGLGPRRRRSAAERRRVVEETLEAGASVARVALKYGVNANQVFQSRRLYRDGKLGATPESRVKLLPVSGTDDEELLRPEPTDVAPSSSGGFTLSFPVKFGSALKAALMLRSFVLCSRAALVIALPAGTRIWIAAEVTDMRRGFHGLSAQVQTVLERQPLSGHVFVFRGRRGDILKVLWFDGDGLVSAGQAA
ncbi:IS66 family insertion sequence element accessory protein TnpB [Tunturiibacter gelidiferens]|uniref:IS66 family insertion sequence element accessory protein TnpB n=1 Tax=Tunturiibacter gelidiferens TaxID=3069689 RepID=UPI003D9BBD21